MKVLVIDIGGTSVKLMVTGRDDTLEFESGPTLTPKKLIDGVRRRTKEWKYDVVSIGYPGRVKEGKPAQEPQNLGPGWVDFDFREAFQRPVKVINDAALQALGRYKEGRMLFLGLGTSVGSALIVDNKIITLELGHLPYRRKINLEELLSRRGRKRLGDRKWRHAVKKIALVLKDAFMADHVVLGGGNASVLNRLPPGVWVGENRDAFEGGCRLWKDAQCPAGEACNSNRTAAASQRATPANMRG